MKQNAHAPVGARRHAGKEAAKFLEACQTKQNLHPSPTAFILSSMR